MIIQGYEDACLMTAVRVLQQEGALVEPSLFLPDRTPAQPLPRSPSPSVRRTNRYLVQVSSVSVSCRDGSPELSPVSPGRYLSIYL